MTLCLSNDEFRYELENICRIFLPDEKVELGADFSGADRYALVREENGDKGLSAKAELWLDGHFASECIPIPRECESDPSEHERILAASLFECFCRLCGFRPKWGILTGVRPAKLMRTKTETLGENGAIGFFTDKMLVSPEKAALCAEVSQSEEAIRSLSSPSSCSVYVSIPFCPTRCSYCSFVSHSIERSADLIEPYLERLCNEIETISETVKRFSLRVETIYVGGGTPSILSASQISRLLACITNSFDMTCVREFTFEAGRPDTIDEDKLSRVWNGGAGRVSINPQTFSDDILRNIGRRHTAEQAIEAIKTARKIGSFAINMDLIAGLDGDTPEGFAKSVIETVALRPENVTVHSLSMKKSSSQVTQGEAHYCAEGLAASEMLTVGEKILRKNGYIPYYMYRQSKTVGNLENVGWTLPGYEGLYNVYMMDETHTILSAGAGAVTKLRCAKTGEIKRVFNYKYPYEYISRFDEILTRRANSDEILKGYLY